jgi:hypothetical protein
LDFDEEFHALHPFLLSGPAAIIARLHPRFTRLRASALSRLSFGIGVAGGFFDDGGNQGGLRCRRSILCG